MKIFITGPAGSGKSTHAKMLAKKFGLYYISGGDLARQKAAENSEEGKNIKETLETGQLVDDELEAKLVQNEIEKSPEKYVLDGFPRSLHQLKYLEPDIDAVIVMDISDKEAKQRLLKRGRVDDNPEAIEERLRIFHDLTMPVIDYFAGRGKKIIKIDGLRDLISLEKEIERSLSGESKL